LSSKEPTLLVVAADRRELEAVCRAGTGPTRIASDLRWSAHAQIQGEYACLATHGPGRQNAGLATRWACERYPIKTVVSTGLAGALDPALRVGELVWAQRIIELKSRVEYPVRLPMCASLDGLPDVAIGKLLTVDCVVQSPAEKAELRKTGARAVDMEASAVAAEANRRGLPFFCIRAVSDTVEARFEIDFNRARRGNGTFSGWRILGQAGLSRRRWAHLKALRRDAEVALDALGVVFGRCRVSDKAN